MDNDGRTRIDKSNRNYLWNGAVALNLQQPC